MRPRRSRRTLNLIGALAVLAALVLAYGWATDFGQRTPPPTAHGHLEQFQALAEEHGDRAMGTPGHEAAAQYVEQQLDNAGYESSRQYFTFEDHGEEFTTFNIIAETEAGSEDNVVMLGAHLDGVPGSPAINDNASGSAALLEAATTLSQQDESTNKVRFAWWGAEEFPQTPGSRHYVQDLAHNDSGALENIAVYLNFDMVASPNPVIAVYDAGESEDPDGTDHAEDSHHGHRPLNVPAGSRQVMGFFTDYFDSRDQPWVTTEWSFASDQVPFIEEDVAVGGLFTGSAERKTDRQASLFGGTAGQPRDPKYHTPGDDLGNVHPEALGIMTDAITHAATTLAQDTSALR